jgi:uncharacterized protein with PQ loop repeat
MMSFVPPGGPGVIQTALGFLSVFTLLMTVPQVLAIWIGHNAGGVSLLSWSAYLVAACFWLIHGVQRRDPSIYLACIGWIILDAAVVIGVLRYS